MMTSKYILTVLAGFLIGMIISYGFLGSGPPTKLNHGQRSPWKVIPKMNVSPEGLVYPQTKVLDPQRRDVLTVTPWLAPIVWEGTFDPLIIDGTYKPLNLTIATTVFAVGKYIRFLKAFLESAEEHYLVGFRVHYYVFTDQPGEVPGVSLGPGRNLTAIRVPKFDRWQEISLRRMEIIRKTIEEQIRREAHFIYCLDVDMLFHDRVGAEVLGELVAALHPWFYYFNRDQFPYERRPASAAYVPQGQGDFYYQAAVFGGVLENVHRLAKTCEDNLVVDKRNDIEAAWQEESHLNKYLIRHKPTKLLSPEYIWDDKKRHMKEVKVIRFSTVRKNLAEVRDN
ncbi:globoside alpha-1,3-N-acetylgalactosaminyltransferase 1-like isoform X2 [Lepisosteus oculatus]|uniref:globoside alpha-1,3-N-acetylgalactosaminyltransferase 1-like isoform X2 n=1 Tax=Lepisosteus oculatus TaxID=7918 RepID=UPI0035F504D6